ncbi:hypothetical protein CFVI02298_09105 [Campylobacter fetus subsp. venerealis cfvi02/298]|uniref:HipA domain-containing protein n=1 Tax=Campylobacter fetus TaxID=196 RepID=UPI0003D8CBCB|nr:HipA domain-containing protein [Campylobacter fetus]OCS40039.1 hypothetical protein CFVI02298_09105 [Campylobacter fetus subsp. venerealis cfvi02/298]AHE94547.1 HipA domain protein [Campylobacter fetus subsp. venerealis cfvi03/293]KAA3683776.1 type II toxin-antitoxin system HipA family toxin [Campylobacter fetus subsp. fetus]KAA3684182.1 type II toxin-antitoxin system HipA family toxin [Campylobacter fetus subsp. venerealis]OCS23478.1 hypothetical protein CFVI9825_08860 [Campylobacter fetus
MQKLTYIFKNTKPYGYIKGDDLFLFGNDDDLLANDHWNELFDILPEGIDLEIMLNSFSPNGNKKELFAYLKNPIGDYYFSQSPEYKNEIIVSDEIKNDGFINLLGYDLKISNTRLYPDKKTSAKEGKIQQLSLSGYQHKLQVGIFGSEIKESYSNYILKPISTELPLLALNEHLHTTFMGELGFKAPTSGVIYDKSTDDFSYIIKRFDIDENGYKKAQISLNALMQSSDKYEGTIDKISKFLRGKLDKDESLKFIGYIYANALLYNSDLHKKNISFVSGKDGRLRLSPAYDVINLYPLSGYSNNQTHLKIAGKNNKILASDFDDIARNFGIDVSENRQNLERIFEIYKEKYPLYLKKLSQNFHSKKVENFVKKLNHAYDINLNNAKKIDLSSILSISDKKYEKIQQITKADNANKKISKER